MTGAGVLDEVLDCLDRLWRSWLVLVTLIIFWMASLIVWSLSLKFHYNLLSICWDNAWFMVSPQGWVGSGWVPIKLRDQLWLIKNLHRDSKDLQGHIPVRVKDISPSQECQASSKPPAMSSIFESVLDAFKLNRFQPNFKQSFLRA